MIRIGIVDDDAASASLLEKYLHRYEAEHGETFALTLFSDGAELLKAYRPDFDILLLDVEMPELDGLSAAEQIRLVDPEVILIFITNAAQHAIRGYEVDALSYVLKPVSYFAFAEQVRKSLGRLHSRAAASVVLRIAGGFVRVSTEDIVFLESAKHRTIVHTLDGKHSVVGPLKDLEAVLEGQPFFRCNSGYLVNLRHVVAVQESSVLLVGGHDLLVSRARKKPFLAALTDYLGARAT